MRNSFHLRIPWLQLGMQLRLLHAYSLHSVHTLSEGSSLQKVVKIQAHVRGYQETEASIDDSEDEDIVKVFREEKVDGAIDEAVSRVLGMVDSPDARQQYRCMLERYQQAKCNPDSLNCEGKAHVGLQI
ncbi:hypothetical protein QYF36_024329 [Acer negundo]|nr:hypothetical protein QYF36_024329 [Acer negundo]